VNDNKPVLTATLREFEIEEHSYGLIPDVSILATDADADIGNARFDITMK
jgi:hypothetical protein